MGGWCFRLISLLLVMALAGCGVKSSAMEVRVQTATPTGVSLPDSQMMLAEQLMQLAFDPLQRNIIPPDEYWDCQISDTYDVILSALTGMLADPAIAQFKPDELGTLFNNALDSIPNVGAHLGVHLFPSDIPDLWLVSISNGCPVSSHRFYGTMLYVIDPHETIWSVGGVAIVEEVQWVNDRWAVVANFKYDSSSGPDPYKLLMVSQAEETWTSAEVFDFTTVGWVTAPPDLDFLSGHDYLVANYLLVAPVEQPCEFTGELASKPYYGTSQYTIAFLKWDGTQYELVEQSVLLLVYFHEEDGFSLFEHWRDYCVVPPAN